MFEDSFIRSEEDFRLKAVVFPISLFIHAFIILLLIALPLSKMGRLPKIGSSGIIQAYIFSPPPAPPAGNSGKPGKKTKIKALPKETLPGLSGFIAPKDIPDGIIDEPFKDTGTGWGVPGGRTDSEADEDLNVFQSKLFRGVFGNDDDDVKVPVRPLMEIKAPRLIKPVDPLYPEIARQARVEGVVVIEATTDIYGRVQNIRILRSIPLLDQAAVDAVRQWVYEPMVINGRPRAVIFTVTVRFQLK